MKIKVDVGKILAEYAPEVICSEQEYHCLRNAMREACNQAIDMAAEIQASKYKDSGFTSTGKKINDLILNTKNQII